MLLDRQIETGFLTIRRIKSISLELLGCNQIAKMVYNTEDHIMNQIPAGDLKFLHAFVDYEMESGV